MDIFVNKQSTYLLVPHVLLFASTSSFIRMMQTSGSLHKTNEHKLAVFFYFTFRSFTT